MGTQIVSRFTICGLFLFHILTIFAEENFLLINGITSEKVMEFGSNIETRVSPCSTFKITLSLMGYDAAILIDEVTPSWEFKDGYDDFLSSWKGLIGPLFWMQYSCVWYSKLLSLELGDERINQYLTTMEYGNQDISGGLPDPGSVNPAWINSSLTISPKEQVSFIQKMVTGNLPISLSAIMKTKALLFKEELTEGWKLYGKTGASGSIIINDGKDCQRGWFVGWVERDHQFFPFAYLICE